MKAPWQNVLDIICPFFFSSLFARLDRRPGAWTRYIHGWTWTWTWTWACACGPTPLQGGCIAQAKSNVLVFTAYMVNMAVHPHILLLGSPLSIRPHVSAPSYFAFPPFFHIIFFSFSCIKIVRVVFALCVFLKYDTSQICTS